MDKRAKLKSDLGGFKLEICFPHTWYLLFFYTGKIFGEKNYAKKLINYDNRISWQNSVNRYLLGQACVKRVRICGQKFVFKNKSKRIFKCDQCDKDYKSQLVLRDHGNRVHLLIGYHVCSICGKSFFGRSKLKRHKRRVHKKCQVEGTQSKFKRHSNNIKWAKRFVIRWQSNPEEIEDKQQILKIWRQLRRNKTKLSSKDKKISKQKWSRRWLPLRKVHLIPYLENGEKKCRIFCWNGKKMNICGITSSPISVYCFSCDCLLEADWSYYNIWTDTFGNKYTH